VGAKLAALIGIVGCGAMAVGSGGAFASEAGAAPMKAKPVSVARIVVDLVDSSRPTAANGTYPGAPTRTLKTTVSYPTRGGRALRGPLPLVVFATGYQGTATNYAPLYDHWVKAGYVVAAPNFPLSGENAPGGSSAADVKNQPADVRFVLDQVLKLDKKRGSKLHGLIDAKRIGLAGKSLGAITVLEVGYNPAERDPRFKAVISLTGAVGNGQHFTGITTPLLLVHGDADTSISIDSSRSAYAAANSPKFFVTIIGSTHGSAFGGASDPPSRAVERTTLDFLDAFVKGKNAGLTRLQTDGNVSGVATLQAAP
jgi:predicted dienelactone hydrolase